MVQLTSTTVLLGFAYSAALISGRAINARMPDGLPSGTSMFAVDETTGKLVTFDASKNPLGEVAPQAKPPRMRRAVGACGAMSTDDVKKRITHFFTILHRANFFLQFLGGRNWNKKPKTTGELASITLKSIPPT
jgi:hypothetical protein